MIILDWKLFDNYGNFLKEVNCQYDSCDISKYEFNAKSIRIDFSKQEAYIIEYEDNQE